MTTLEKKLGAALKRLGAGEGASIVVAVSGGADSTALLDALVRRREQKPARLEIFVAHLNHRLRGEESDEDEQFVKALADRLKLRCLIERVETAAQAQAEKKNLEAMARRLRYDFLQRVAENHRADFVFTAHTRDDQVETILMRLLRGSGAAGLRGIHEIRALGEKATLARPLLGVTRAEVLAHGRHYGLVFRTDSSNFSADFTRNRVRGELLPLLRSFNPKSDEALIRAAELISKDEEYLQQISAELLAGSRRGPALQIDNLVSAHPALRRRALRLWLGEELGSLLKIDSAHLAALENLIIRSQSGRQIELPGSRRVIREFSHLLIEPPEPRSFATRQPIAIKDSSEISFGNFKLVLQRNVPRESVQEKIMTNRQDSSQHWVLLRECDALDELQVRVRAPGDAYQPVGSRHKIKLKTLMIRRKIPVSQRDTYPVLATANDRIVWAPGLPVAAEFALRVDDQKSLTCALIRAQETGKFSDGL